MSNPLSQTNPQSIDELLSRDPLSLTEHDIEENTKQLIIMLRSNREVWEQEKAKAKLTGKRISGQTTKKKQKEEALKKISTGAKIDLGSLIKK